MGIKLPIDTREKAVPGGSVLPSPSWQNVTHQKIVPNALGVLGKAIEEVGYTVQQVNDRTELEKQSLKTESKISGIILQNSTNIQDPQKFRDKTAKEVSKVIDDARNNINFRNRQEFDIISTKLGLDAEAKIATGGIKKTVDLSAAQFTISKNDLMEKYLAESVNPDTGLPYTEEDVVGAVNTLIQDRFDTGVFDAEKSIKEEADYQADLARLDFLKNYEDDPKTAVEKLEKNKWLSSEQKINLHFKMSGRITKVEKKQEKERKAKIQADADELYRLLVSPEDGREVKQEDIDKIRGDGLGGSELRVLQNKFNEIEDKGGVGDTDLRNTHSISILNADTIEDLNSIGKIIKKEAGKGQLNTPQTKELIASIESRKAKILKGERPLGYTEYKGMVKTLFGAESLDTFWDADRAIKVNVALGRYIKLIDGGKLPSEAYLQVKGEIPLPMGSSTKTIDQLDKQLANSLFLFKQGKITEKAYKRRVESNKKAREFRKYMDEHGL